MSIARRRLAEAQAALMLLTRLPAGRLPDPAPALSATAWAYPLVGAVVGAIGGAAWLGALALGLPAMAAALMAMAAAALITGGLHEDGAADLADGFGGGQSRARKLEIMRDSRIGSYGVTALILLIGLRATGMAEVAPGWSALALFIAIGAVSRWGMSCAMAVLPPARDDGLGRGASGVGAGQVAVGALFALLALLPLGWSAAAIILIMAGAALAVALLALRQIGGQTGDALGAMQQAAETAGWLAAAALIV